MLKIFFTFMILSFPYLSSNALYKLTGDGYIKTVVSKKGVKYGRFGSEFGLYWYKIDPNCMKELGDDIIERVNQVIITSIVTLENNVNKYNNMHKHSIDLKELLRYRRVAINCTAISKRYRDAIASASIGSNIGVPNKNDYDLNDGPLLIKPFIVLNMDKKYTVHKQLGNTILHELFHNIRYDHLENEVEYPYTCAECIFPSTPTNSSSCKICRNTYDLNNKSEKERYFTDLCYAQKEGGIRLDVYLGSLGGDRKRINSSNCKAEND